MQNRRHSLLYLFDNTVDLIINACAIYIALLFASLIDNKTDIIFSPTSPAGIISVLTILIITSFAHQACNYNKPSLDFLPIKAYGGIIKANLLTVAIISVSILFFISIGYRIFFGIWIFLYAIISTLLLIFKRNLINQVIHWLRRNQYVLRRTIIVGDNSAAAREYVLQITNNPSHGIMMLGYVGDKIDPDIGCEKLGGFKDLVKVLDRYRPTDVVFAIDSYDKRHLIKLVNLCEDRLIKVYFLPVIYGFFKSQRQIEQIGEIPLINIHSTPLNNQANALAKRTFDVLGAIFLIILTSPIMLAAAIGIKLTSPGPILFKQSRVGMMGKSFTMLKFRSMPVNKDAENNWTTPGDARPTRFGSFLRRTAIDELPQFFNVLAGSMSLVGPRPEMPKFVEQFKETVPLYMVKHYVKPGVTGLAQIKGWRGDTSVEERIRIDISYIENWTMGLDLMILLKTPFKAFNKYERYVEKPDGEPEGFLATAIAKLNGKYNVPQKVIKPNRKILYAASTYGHIKSFHLPYIKRLREEGHTVLTMAAGEEADFNVPFKKKIFSTTNRKCRKQIKKILEDEQFDLIILNTSLAAFHIRATLNKRTRPRVVYIVHGFLFEEVARDFKMSVRSAIISLAEKLMSRRTDAMLTMNDEDFRIATRKNLTRGPVIPTFGMGVPYPEFKFIEGDLRRLYSDPDDFVLLFAGEFSTRKNQTFLIDSMPKILETAPNARLWLLGNGDKLDAVKQRAVELGVADRVNFFGYRNAAPDFMRDCDLYVSASKNEGLPFNIVEALGCKKKVLASRVKGHRDILEGGVGVLYKLDSSKDFMKKFKSIYYGNLTLREERILEGYANFSEIVVADDTYEKLKEAAWL